MPKTARYGVQVAWIKKTVNRDAQCTNSYFRRDPEYGVLKSCQVQAAVTASPPPAALPPGPLPVTIAELGLPRVLLRDTATMVRVRSAVTSFGPSAVRF